MERLPGPPAISLITLAELNGGLASEMHGERRRKRLAILLSTMDVVGFDRAVVDAYGELVRTLGFSRRRVLDRLIAATALVHDFTLITTNGPDFRDIPGLKLEVWPAPAQYRARPARFRSGARAWRCWTGSTASG
jgi:predicted nucleic acid-binding protein